MQQKDMSIGLKVSLLECKRIFYRPKHNVKELNFKGLEMQEMKQSNGQRSIIR